MAKEPRCGDIMPGCDAIISCSGALHGPGTRANSEPGTGPSWRNGAWRSRFSASRTRVPQWEVTTRPGLQESQPSRIRDSDRNPPDLHHLPGKAILAGSFGGNRCGSRSRTGSQSKFHTCRRWPWALSIHPGDFGQLVPAAIPGRNRYELPRPLQRDVLAAGIYHDDNAVDSRRAGRTRRTFPGQQPALGAFHGLDVGLR